MNTRRDLSFMVMVLCLIMIVAVCGVSPAYGEKAFQTEGITIRVTTTTDEISQNNHCSVREAVLAANRDEAVGGCPAGNGTDTILIPVGSYIFVIPGADENDGLTGDLDIWDSVNIRGAGAGVTKFYTDNVADRFIQIHGPSTMVQIGDIQFLGAGLIGQDNASPITGGAIENAGTLYLNRTIFRGNHVEGAYLSIVAGGAINNTGRMFVTDARFEDNHARVGAAISNDGEMRIENAFFTHNDSVPVHNDLHGNAVIVNSEFQKNGEAPDGEFLQNIGAIKQLGKMVIRNSRFLDNRASYVGAISNEGDLLIEDSTIAGNYTNEGPAGIEQLGGNLTIRRSSILNNRGGFSGGGLVIDGAESVWVEQSLFYGNSNYDGGGIRHKDGPTTILNTTFENNGAYTGGAIRINGTGVKIIGSTFVGNGVAEEGGAIHANEPFTIENSTISGNTCGEKGGGIYLASDGVTSITNTTIVHNEGGGLVTSYSYPGTALVRSSIIAENFANSFEPQASDCFTYGGEVTSQGWNLIGIIDGCNWKSAESDLLGTSSQPIDPMLDSLLDNGGPTYTHALIPGSPALDAAGTQDCPDTDQRGVPRPQGPACDIGAFELQVAQPVLENWIYMPVIHR